MTQLSQRLWPRLALGWFLALGLAACDDPLAVNSDLQIFRYNQPNHISSLDPAFARSQNNIWACQHLYNGLLQLDTAMQIRPALAKRWHISPDGLRYTFVLRQDVRFHDAPIFPGGKGRPLRAADVAFSFARLLDPEVASPGSWVFAGKVRDTLPFEAPNDSTFVLHLRQPFRPMLGILTMAYCSVLPQEAASQPDFRKNPVGTGPFRFKRWIEDQSLFLLKNPHYFERDAQGRPLPYLDGVRVQFIKDRKTAFLSFLRGELDHLSGLDAAYVDVLLTPQGELQPELAERFSLHKAPFLNSEYLGFGLHLAEGQPWADRRLRQALNYGIDRPLMLRTLRNGIGQAADAGFVPRGLPAHDPAKVPGYRYDPAKARALMAEAGYPNGQGLPPLTLLTNADYADLCTFLAGQWAELGIDVRIELSEAATLRERMAKGEAAFFRASWIADYPDEESFFTVFYGQNPAPPRYTRFRSAHFDALYERALRSEGDSLRQAIYQAMDRCLVEEAPVVFLFYDESAIFLRRGTEGLRPGAFHAMDLRYLRLPPPGTAR